MLEYQVIRMVLLPRIAAEFRAMLAPLQRFLAVVSNDLESCTPLADLELHDRMRELASQLERASSDVRHGLGLITTGVPDPRLLGAESVVPVRAGLHGGACRGAGDYAQHAVSSRNLSEAIESELYDDHR